MHAFWVWDSNAPALPTVLVAWNNDAFGEGGSRFVKRLALGEVLNLYAGRAVLMDYLEKEEEQKSSSTPSRSWYLK